MSDIIADQFKDELNPDEKIEWCGRPSQFLYFEIEDLQIIAPTLFFTGLFIYGLIRSLHDNLFWLFLFLCFFGTIQTMIIVFGKLVVSPLRRRRTIYSVTNQRIIIRSGIFNRNTKSLQLEALKEINISVRNHGRGTIRLGNSMDTPWTSRFTRGQYYLAERTVYVPQFDMIEDVQKVYDLIKKLQNEKK